MNQNLKTKILLNSSNSLILGNIVHSMSLVADEESKELLEEITRYLLTRTGKAYGFFNIKEIYAMWSCIKTCFDDELMIFTEEEKLKIAEMLYQLALILDNPNDGERNWREFTSI